MTAHGRLVNEADTLTQKDRKSTRLNSSHSQISYAVFCLKKKKNIVNSRCVYIKAMTVHSQPSCNDRTCTAEVASIHVTVYRRRCTLAMSICSDGSTM